MLKFDIIILKRIAFCFLIISILFIVAQYVQIYGLYEEGFYVKYTLSFLRDGDLNIINNEPSKALAWLVTKTGYHPDFQHPAIASYLSLFFAYYILVDKLLGLASAVLPMDFLASNILFSLFFVLLGLSFLPKIFNRLKIQHSYKSIAFIFLSFSTLWFSLFSSTTTNIFALCYSIIVYSFYLLVIDESNDNVQVKNIFILAIASGFGLALRAQLLWCIVLLPFLFFKTRTKYLKKLIAILVGFSIPAVCMFINNHLRGGNGLHPQSAFLELHLTSYFFPLTLKDTLFGPSGYFLILPVFIILVPATIWLIIKKKLPGHLIAALLFFISFLLLMSASWTTNEDLSGRHQLDTTFLIIIITGILLTKVQKRSHFLYKSLIVLFSLTSIWNIITTFSFGAAGYRDLWNWNNVYSSGLNEFLTFSKILYQRFSIYDIRRFFKMWVIHIPLITLLSFLLEKINRTSLENSKNWIYGFIFGGAFLFIFITSLNFYNGPINVIKYKKVGLYRDKVIGNSDLLFVYDNWTEVWYRTMLHYLKNNECETVKKLLIVRKNYINEIRPAVIYDPNILFKNNILKPSSLLNDSFNKEFNQVREEKCHF